VKYIGLKPAFINFRLDFGRVIRFGDGIVFSHGVFLLSWKNVLRLMQISSDAGKSEGERRYSLVDTG
jgi:hypothetical protein